MEEHPTGIFHRLQIPGGQVLTGAPPGFPLQQQTLCNFRPGLVGSESDSNSVRQEESVAQFPKNFKRRNDSDGYLSSEESSSCSEKLDIEKLQKPEPHLFPPNIRMVSCNDLENALRGKAKEDVKPVDPLNEFCQDLSCKPPLTTANQELHSQQKGVGPEEIEKEKKQKDGEKQTFEEEDLPFIVSQSASQKLQTPDFYTGRPLLRTGPNGNLLPGLNSPLLLSSQKSHLIPSPNNSFLCTPSDMLLSNRKDSLLPSPQSSLSSSPSDSFLTGQNGPLPPPPKCLLLPSPSGQLPSPKSPILPPPGFGNHQPMRGSIYMFPQIQTALPPSNHSQTHPQSPSQPQPWSPALQSSRQQLHQQALLRHQMLIERQQQQKHLQDKHQNQPRGQMQHQLWNSLEQPKQQQQELRTEDVIRRLQTLALRVKNVEKNCIKIQNLENIEKEVLQNKQKVSKRQKYKEKKKKRAQEKQANMEEGPSSEGLGNEAANVGSLLKHENINDPGKKNKKKKKRKNKKEEEQKESENKDEQIFKPGIFSKCVLSSEGVIMKKDIFNKETFVQKNEHVKHMKEQEHRKKSDLPGKELDMKIKDPTNTPEKKRRKSKKNDENFEDYLPLPVVEERINNKTLIEGEFRINAKNHLESFVTDQEKGSDILIFGLLDRNRALDGDIVAVEIKDDEHWLKQKNGTIIRTGKVVHIIERVHHCHTVGTLRLQKGFFMLVSRDSRFPLLRIPTISLPKSVLSEFSENVKESNQLFKGLLLSWNIPRFANGMIKESMGKKGNIDVETTAIFAELGLDKNPISHAFNKFLPKLPYMISDEEIASRLDLRSEVIFTIDPATARDLDDAVSVKVLSEGVYEVGVHISDVTHFLTQGTPLDVEVSERATTVYMVERAYHMLPIELCGLCSLVPGEDKLAVSVIFKLDEEGNVLDSKFSRTIINSCVQLSYDHAQAFIEGEEKIELPVIHNDIPVSTIRDAILCLNKIAINRRKRRFNTGALKIDQPKVCFDIDSDCNPQSMYIYELKDSHRLIEEFMLLANESVAIYLHSKVPDIALLRRHEPPKAEMMTKLANSLQKLDIFLDLSSAGALHQTLSKYTDDVTRATVLNQLCAKPMNRAAYFCSCDDTHHYALNLEKYTHFTSPIRRYADIVVHRLLTACLGYSELPPWTTQDVCKFASTSNRKKWAAKRAGEMSSHLFKIMYIKSIGEIVTDAVVTWVNSHSLDTHVPSMALNIRVYVDKLTFEYNENDIGSSIVLKWPGVSSPQVLQVFSSIKVCLKYSERSDNIEAKLIPPVPDVEVKSSDCENTADLQN